MLYQNQKKSGKANNGKKESKRIYHTALGFWRKNKDEESKFPFPESNSFSDKEKEKFLKWFPSFIEDNKERVDVYRGPSICRICGKINDNKEYQLRFVTGNDVLVIRIPSGYLHYIEEHNVRPPIKFLNALKKGDFEKAKSFLRPIANIDKDGERMFSWRTDTIYFIDETYPEDKFRWNSAISELNDLSKRKKKRI